MGFLQSPTHGARRRFPFLRPPSFSGKLHLHCTCVFLPYRFSLMLTDFNYFSNSQEKKLKDNHAWFLETVRMFKPPDQKSREALALDSKQLKLGSHQLTIQPALRDAALKISSLLVNFPFSFFFCRSFSGNFCWFWTTFSVLCLWLLLSEKSDKGNTLGLEWFPDGRITCICYRRATTFIGV